MRNPPRRRAFQRRILSTTAVAALSLAALSFAPGTAALASDRTPLPAAKPSWAKPANDAGAAADSTTYEGYIALDLRDAAGAEAYAAAVSSPGSPLFHQYISPQRWIAQYAPTKDDLASVVAEITSYGFTIEAIPASRIFVSFRGTVDQFEQAFSTSIHRYRVSGHTLLAPSSTPSVSTSIGRQVSALSISTGAATKRPAGSKADVSKSQVAAAGRVPCSSYFGQKVVTTPPAYGRTTFPTAICGYSARQLRAIATTNSGQGAGQTVAIVDAYASPTIVADTNRLSAAEGEPSISGLYSQVGVDRSRFVDQELCGGEEGWQGEQSLDVQAVHAVAPRARIVYSAGLNCGAGLYDAVSRVLDNRLASLVSNSYGGPEEFSVEADYAIYDALGWQAAAEGIGLFASTGDDGDFTIDGIPKDVSLPAANPYWTAVGGTSVGLDKRNRIAFETGWGNISDPFSDTAFAQPLPGTYYGGAGGGTSTIWSEPTYQRGVVPDSIAQGQRAVPDIASLADPYTGFQLGYSPILADGSTATGPFALVTFGGTSLASPITAAQIAVAQQETGIQLGFANPVLYAVDRVAPGVFRDVLPAPMGLALAAYSTGLASNVLVTLDRDSSLVTTRGWDEVTGIGALSLNGYKRMLR